MPGGRAVWSSFAALAVTVSGLLVALVVLGRSSPVPDLEPVVQFVPGAVTPETGPAGIGTDKGPVDSTPRPSTTWTAQVAAATGIPVRAVQAYGAAQLALAASDPGCRLGWNTVAGIAAVESDHGRHDGAAIGADGVDRPTVLGPPLDGTDGNKALADTDGGRLDGDTTWDRAVGPMQFIPETWAQWGRSATGGVPDPSDIDDAALTAGRYLCAAGVDMSTADGWNLAIGTYNEPVEYAVEVAGYANDYATASRS